MRLAESTQSQTTTAFARLGRPQKAAFLKRLRDSGMSQGDIASTLQIDRTTVYRILQRPVEVARVRRKERGRARLNARQLRMLRYGLHDHLPKEAKWSRAAKAKFSFGDHIAFSLGFWTLSLVRAIVLDRYPQSYEAHCSKLIFRRFMREQLRLVKVKGRWLQANDEVIEA